MKVLDRHYLAYVDIIIDLMLMHRFLVGVDEFQLLEDSFGLRFWSPAIPGDSKFYEQLSCHPWYYNPYKDEFRHALPYVLNKDVLELVVVLVFLQT